LYVKFRTPGFDESTGFGEITRVTATFCVPEVVAIAMVPVYVLADKVPGITLTVSCAGVEPLAGETASQFPWAEGVAVKVPPDPFTSTTW
jgi:hypothetical protein